jgi:hypothetical protein
MSLLGCSAAGPSASSVTDAAAAEEESPAGTVSLQLVLPGGEQIASVAYDLTNGTNRYAGTASAVVADTIAVVIGGVAVGGGYTISITATSNDGTITCTGSHGTGVSDAGQDNGGPFSVATHVSTLVNVAMVCVRNKS